jgi:TolB-like protein
VPPELFEQLQHTLGSEYHVGHELGGGGMARVFVAEDERLHRRIVVKVLSPDLAAGVSVDRFRREIQVAGRLHHPHIVRVLDAGQSSALLYYTMPLIDGESLRALLARERQLPLDRALTIARDLGDALDYAHRENIVHRDIKPDNILVESSGRAMVTDFGIARAIEKAADIESVTSTGLTLGTPTYMSPEQATAERSIDGRSDQYSLACVLYEMLAGAPPFTATTARALIAMHVSERPRSLLVVRPDLPTHVDAALQKALAKAPADRFRCVGDFIAALEGVPALTRGRSSAGVARVGGSSAFRIAAIALVVALVALALALLHPWAPSAPDAIAAPGGPPVSHVAVLYLDAPADDPRLADIAHGVTRDLIYALQRVPELTLVSELGIRRFGSRAAPDSVARELGVGTVIHGTVERYRDSVRVDMHLTDGATLVERGSVRITAGRDAWIALDDSVVQEVGALLRQQVSQAVRLQEWRASTRSSRAWELRQRAQELVNRAGEFPGNPADFGPQRDALARAESLLVRASAEDPRWTEPLVARGWLLALQTDLTSSRGEKESLIGRGIALADEVLAKEPQSATALELRGYLRFKRYSEIALLPALRDSAERDLRRATDDDRQLARAWSVLSLILDEKRDAAGALYAARRAVEADAYRPEAGRSTMRLVMHHLLTGSSDSARTLCDAARHRFPNDRYVLTCTVTVLGYVGYGPADVERAWRSLGEVEREGPYTLVNGVWPPGRFLVAATIARTGWRDSALAVVRATRDALRGTPDARNWRMNEAHPRLLVGERDRALELLEEAVRGEPALRAAIAMTPWFTTLHGDPRFQRIVAER